MKIRDVLTEALGDFVITPSAVRQQARVDRLVAKMLADIEHQPATDADKLLAAKQVRDLQKRADYEYAQKTKLAALRRRRG